MEEIERLKGKDLKIENAFILKKNNLLYLFTNDQDTFDRLNENWPLNAFKNGVKIIKEYENKRLFLAINGVDTKIDIDKDQLFKEMCQVNKIIKAKRLIKKKDNKQLPIIQIELNDKNIYDNLLKFGIKLGWFNYRVSIWKFDDSPIQCYKCQKFGHNQRHCTSEKQICLICAGEHSYKSCDNKQNVKCSNCNQSHSSSSKDCEARSKAIQSKQAKLAKYVSTKVTANKPFNTVVGNSNRNIITSGEQNKVILNNIIHLFALLVSPNDKKLQNAIANLNNLINV
jgi:uncharacterized protein YhbP (UPF0306 family)